MDNVRLFGFEVECRLSQDFQHLFDDMSFQENIGTLAIEPFGVDFRSYKLTYFVIVS